MFSWRHYGREGEGDSRAIKCGHLICISGIIIFCKRIEAHRGQSSNKAGMSQLRLLYEQIKSQADVGTLQTANRVTQFIQRENGNVGTNVPGINQKKFSPAAHILQSYSKEGMDV